jgi:hypothetical protein
MERGENGGTHMANRGVVRPLSGRQMNHERIQVLTVGCRGFGFVLSTDGASPFFCGIVVHSSLAPPWLHEN